MINLCAISVSCIDHYDLHVTVMVSNFSPNNEVHQFYRITGVPEQPQNVSAIEIYSRNLTLVWVQPRSNNVSIQGYRVMFRHPLFLNGYLETVEAGTERALISGLYALITYNFTVVAYNANGDSPPSQPAVVTTVEEGASSRFLNP